jgi:hypothetical protein
MISSHLTKPQGERLAALQEITIPGMAHWAGSGPDGETCRQCAFWSRIKRVNKDTGDQEYGAIKRIGRQPDGTPSPRACSKYSQLMRGIRGGKIPFDTPACNKFEASGNAPPAALPPNTAKSKSRKPSKRVTKQC